MSLLMLSGYTARLSDSKLSWDIEVILSGGIKRIQVKSGYWNCGKWTHCLSKKRSGHAKTGRKNHPYNREDFDYLLIDDPTGFMYMIPVNVLHFSQKTADSLPMSSTNLHIRYSDYLINYAPAKI